MKIRTNYQAFGGKLIALIIVFLSFYATLQAQRVISDNPALIHTGIASYYNNKFNGRLTSTGEVFSNAKMTAASNTLPLGTYVRVTNKRNGESVIVRINDRMNIYNNRAIDLSRKAAQKLGMVQRGLTTVKIEVVPIEFYTFFNVSPEVKLIVSEKEQSKDKDSGA